MATRRNVLPLPLFGLFIVGDDFQLLISKLDLFNKYSIIGLESTAHYGDNLVRYLVASIYKIYVINLMQTSSIRKNNIRKAKTHKVNTYIRRGFTHF